MKKHVFGRQLQRDTNERKALFKSLMTALIVNESIKTTEAKAKAVRGEIEKLVTKAKKEGETAERKLQAYFSQPVIKKLINDVAPRFSQRPGGYTRIIKIGSRLRDNAKMVILEWAEKKPEVIKGEIVGQEQEISKSSPASEQIEAAVAVKEPKVKKETKTSQTKEKAKDKKSPVKKAAKKKIEEK